MWDKKNNIFQNPFLLSTGISALLSGLASIRPISTEVMKFINMAIPPFSLILSYGLAWILAKVNPLSISEHYALSRLKAREKLIRKDIAAGGISQQTERALKRELDAVILEKSQIGKTGIIISESHLDN
nr:MAG TPA: hypothetical protein [Caudoviricetes sp.]